MQAIRTGTMGWAYDDWKGVFYAHDVKQADMLQEYGRVSSLGTVELDSTFYGTPRPTTLDSWASQTPGGFLFSAKVPRAITHERRLVHAGEAALDFAELLDARLGPKLGALLLQLPPDFIAEERETLERFVDDLSRRRGGRLVLPWVVEFRHASWADTNIAAYLAERGIVCATTERVDVGGPLRYVRLLGIENSVARFDARQFDRSADIAAWATRIQEARTTALPDTPPLLVYVRNFFEGHAPATIALLREKLGLPNATPPGQQQMSLF